MNIFFEKEIQNKWICLARYILYFFVTWLPFLFIKIPALSIVLNVAGLFLITRNYSVTVAKRLVSTMFIYLLLACTEVFVILIGGYRKLALLEQSGYESLFGQICVMILIFMFTLLLERFEGIKKGDNFPLIYWFCIFIVPISSLMFIFQMLNTKFFAISAIAFDIVILLFINFAVFSLYDALAIQFSNNIESELLRQQNKFYTKQFEIMEISDHSVRSVKHDLKNHLGTVRQLAGKADNDEVVHYINLILSSTVVEEEHSDCGNIELNSLLNFKISEAIQKNVQVETELVIPNNMDMEIYDLVIILGNLLDNAFEAVSNPEVCERKVSLKMKYDRGRLFIKVTNRFAGKLKYDENKEFLKTTKDNSQGHGNGLNNVRKSIERYHGTIDIEEKNNIFGVFVMLYTNKIN